MRNNIEYGIGVKRLKCVLPARRGQRRIQRAPHPVLLDRAFYHRCLRPPLTQWALLWLHEHGAVTVDTHILLEYLTAGPRHAGTATLKAVTAGAFRL